MMMHVRPPGKTQKFVLPSGFVENHGRLLLLDHDGSSRIFFELTADPDHPHTRLAEAWGVFLAGMYPGAVMRVLHLLLPHFAPRRTFLKQVRSWPGNQAIEEEKMSALLDEYLQRAPVPMNGRTILELVVPSRELMEWAESSPEQLRPFGITARLLSPKEVQDLAHWIFNPEI